jgi:hypothetical protein
VRDLATGVGLAIRAARALHLPVEPGVPAGRAALILWAHLPRVPQLMSMQSWEFGW